MSNSEESRAPLLTAIVPVNDINNRIHFLMRWLKDCSNPDIRVILVHDSGVEVERILLKEFVSKLAMPNIKIIEVSLGSPGKSRNAGIAHVDTPFVCFWDSDDFPHVAIVLEKLLTLNTETDVLIGQFDMDNQKTLGRAYANSTNQNLASIYSTNPGLWRMIFSSRLLRNLHFSEHRIAEDQLFLSRLEMADLNYTIIQDSLYTYIHHQNLRLTQSISAYPDLLAVQGELINVLGKQSSENKSLTSILLVRVFLAGLKRMSFVMKLASINIFLPLFITPTNAVLIIHAMAMVTKYRLVRK